MLWPWLPGRGPRPQTLVVYGFSILSESINQAVFPAFQRHWKSKTGQTVELVSSFAGSGTVANQVLLGVPAQVVILALETDAEKWVASRLLPGPEWQKLPQRGVLNRTPFVLLVRPGNPKKIRDFADLARPGVRVLHPDPLTSGGAQWALLAEYGSAVRSGQSAEQAQQQMLGIWRNVVAQSSSARSARTQFSSGFGDALITYEQDLLHDARAGKLEGEIVYPSSTVLSEHTVVQIPHNVKPAERELVDAFVQYLWSDEAQKIFAEWGFRSVDPKYNGSFEAIKQPFTVSDLGGWQKAKPEIVEQVWKQRVLPELGK